MNEMRVPQPEQVAATPPPSRPADPLRRWTLAILVLCVLLFGWTLIADRLTPYTSDASVRAFVVRLRPEVSGKVIEVAVHDNQIVRTGDLVYRIDPAPFRIAVERAAASLASARSTAMRNGVGSIRYTRSPVRTIWLSCTATSITLPETSGLRRTTKVRTLASLV